MKNVFKMSAFALLLSAIAVVSSCNVEDALTDSFSDDLPNSFLGTWEDGNENQVILKAGSITYDGEVQKFEIIVKITANGVDVYSADTNDADSTTDYYIKQPDSADELEISLTAVSSSDYVTYTRVQN